MSLKEVSEAQNTQEKDEGLERRRVKKGQKELRSALCFEEVPGECEAIPDLVETLV